MLTSTTLTDAEAGVFNLRIGTVMTQVVYDSCYNLEELEMGDMHAQASALIHQLHNKDINND
jgi:hypothetical protein